MNFDLTNKHALVCGASKGIGKAAAIALSQIGANVTLVARSADVLSNVIDELEDNGDQKHNYLVADFNNPIELKKRVHALTFQHPYQILINNTGGPKSGSILDAQSTAFEDAFKMHLIANHTLAKLLIPGMIKANYGRIINIISTSVKAPIKDLGVSNTIRAAVANWAKTLSVELGIHGITVNNVLPGFTATQRLDELIKAKALKSNISEEEAKRMMQETVPMRRFADPSELGNAIAFLASPAASYINGINLPVDGGKTQSL